MPAPAVIAAVGSAAASQKGGDKGGGGGMGGFQAPKNPIDAVTELVGQRKEARAANAARQQQIGVDAANHAQDVATADAQNAITADSMGPSGAEFITGDQAFTTDWGAMGGESTREDLMRDAGYDPSMANNPFVQSYGYGAQAEDAMKAHAEGVADSTISDFERVQAENAAQYDESMANASGERESRQSTYEDIIAGLQVDQTQNDAQATVEMWMGSNKTGKGEGRFEDGIRGRKGAKNGKKREIIDELLGRGWSYEDILNSSEVGGYIQANPESGPMFNSGGY